MIARELNDFGGFESKPSLRRWMFWPRSATANVVVRSGATWIAARELAARHFAELGLLVATQDLESAPVEG